VIEFEYFSFGAGLVSVGIGGVSALFASLIGVGAIIFASGLLVYMSIARH
jgi:hypothetical protein